jgi:hypothetical protein
MFLAIITFCQLVNVYTSYTLYKMSKMPDEELAEMLDVAKELVGEQKVRMARSKSVESKPREDKKVG